MADNYVFTDGKLWITEGMDDPMHSGWGGKREGAGRPVIHTDPEIRERTKKFRATDQEWEEFLDMLPDDSREAFQYLKTLFDELNDYGDKK